MGSKENNPSKANLGNNNRRRFNNRKTGSAQKSANCLSTSNKPKVRELIFYLYDSAQRKTSESYGKIVDAIIVKIQKYSNSPLR